jgi:hypothetical protein
MTGNLRLTATIFALFLAVLSYAAGLPGINAPDRLAQKDDSEQSVRDLEQRWLENEDSPDALETILADDFVHVLAMGFISRHDQIEYLSKHPRASRSTKHFDELRVRIYGSVAIANGIVSELPEGGTAPQKTIFTDVFAKRQGVWQAVNAQELPFRTQSQ